MDVSIIFTLACMGICAIIGLTLGIIIERRSIFETNAFCGNLVFVEDIDGLHMLAELDLEPGEIVKHNTVYFFVRKPHKHLYGNKGDLVKERSNV